MSFKTFTCHSTSQPDPLEPWNVSDTMIQIANETDIQALYVCDNQKSFFNGAAEIEAGMTIEEFNTLWPLLAGLMVTGYIVKRLRWAVMR